MFSQEHLDYVIAAVKALYEDRENIPNMKILWGHNLPIRHFHAFLEPYPNKPEEKNKKLITKFMSKFKICYNV